MIKSVLVNDWINIMLDINQKFDDVEFSVFEEIKHLITQSKVENFANLHQGKTYFPPCADITTWRKGDFELEAHHHASPQGIQSLRMAISQRLYNVYQKTLSQEHVVITAGATHAVSVALHAFLEPGDEVMLLSPQWLFAYGLVRLAGGIPKEVPVFSELSKDKEFDFISILESSITKKTKALYFNNPNNPTGVLLGPEDLRKLLEFAHKHHLWIIADNAYENYDYKSENFQDIYWLDGAQEITFSIYTFSKTYAMPGYRVGYLIPPANMLEAVKKSTLYSVYSVCTASQFGAMQAIKVSSEELLRRKHLAQEARDIAFASLTVPSTFPDGGLYMFLDLSEWQNGNVKEFIRQCIIEGVSLAPGIAFGSTGKKQARLCFTAVEPKLMSIGIQRINKVYAHNS